MSLRSFVPACLAASLGCRDPGTRPAPSASAPSVASSANVLSHPDAIATAKASTSSARTADSTGPPLNLRASAPRVAGFRVYDVGGVTVSFKSYYVDNVDQKKDAAYPSCASLPPGTHVVASGPLTPKSLNESPDGPSPGQWQVFQEGDRFGVFGSQEYMPHGDYGDQHECCSSGDELAATHLKATLTRAEADEALEACQWLLHNR